MVDVEFRLLGRVEAWRDGRPVELGGPKQRAVLASLLLRDGRLVSVDQLIDDPSARPAEEEAPRVDQGRQAGEEGPGPAET